MSKNTSSSSGRIFVTVGSTGFDKLISQVSSSQFLNAAKEYRYREIIVQYGSSSRQFTPNNLNEAKNSTLEEEGSVSISGFDYDLDLDQYFDSSDLIISHAGNHYIYMIHISSNQLSS